MITSNDTLLKITAGKTEDPMYAEIVAKEKIALCEWCVKDKDGNVKQSGQVDGVGTRVEFTAQFDAKAWSVEAPNTYALFVNLSYQNGKKEEIIDNYGYRYFNTDNKYIYLNGYPFYMRAYIRGCAAHEHQNNCNLSEYEFYKKNILAAKSYGFNTIRFHSVIPPEECFKAADDLGILIHIEMRKQDDDYDNLEEMLYGKNDFISDDRLLEIIHTLYNHPSFMVYCVGNEIRQPGKKPRIREIRDFIKKHDPTRLFIDTCAHGEYDRDYVDFDVQHMSYFYPYGKNADMFENTDNLLCFGTVKGRDMVKEESDGGKIRRGIAFPRPLIAHEVCHYTSWRDFYALKEKFKKFGRPAPWWVDEEIKMIEAKGYKDNFAEMLALTKDFQFRCWKTAIEAIRLSGLLSGFHMLQFADTDRYENSNGVVDCFDDAHGISPEQFRKFNADTVLVARLQKRVFSAEELANFPVFISQYAINPQENATFSYALSEGDTVVRRGTLEDVDTGESGLHRICSLEFKLPKADTAKKLLLTCALEFSDKTKVENSWEIWVFPNIEESCEINAASDMKEDYLSTAFKFNPNARLTVTDKLDDTLFERLERGEDVMLICRTDWTRHILHKDMSAPKYSFRHVWERYKGVIWDRGTINGGYDMQSLLNRHGFVSDGQINYHYYTLIDDCDKINLDDFPIKVTSIVSGLDKSSRDRFDATKFRLPELMYDRTMRNFSYAFALKVGNGRLLVTGFNFTSVKAKDPAASAMFKTLVSYANSEDFAPDTQISVADLKAYLEKVASEGPQKEGMMTQYWQLDEEPVESMEYWKESERYLREAPERKIERYIVKQK